MEIAESLGLNDYQKLRLQLAANLQKELIRAGYSTAQKPTTKAVAQADELLDELGIIDPDLT